MSKQLIFVMLSTTLAIVSVTHGAMTEGNLHEGNPTEGTTTAHNSPTLASILQQRKALDVKYDPEAVHQAVPQAVPQEAVHTDGFNVVQGQLNVVKCCFIYLEKSCVIRPRSELCTGRRVELNEEEAAAYLESLKSGTSTVAAPAPESVAAPAPESVAAPASESVAAPAPARRGLESLYNDLQAARLG